MSTNQIGIIGYGRFGRVMMRLLKPGYDVFFYDVDEKLHQEQSFKSLQELVKLPTLILAVPISQMKGILQQITPDLKAQTVMDICSVKVYPTQWMLEYLPEKINVIATHPMFGPDSYDNNAYKNMMMYSARAPDALFQAWHHYFSSKNINVSVMSPEQHDRESAFSQNLTHFLGRVLGEINLKDTKIATVGYSSLLKIVQQTCHDSWELFRDILQYNPYGKSMIEQFNMATHKIINKLDLTREEKTHGK